MSRTKKARDRNLGNPRYPAGDTTCHFCHQKKTVMRVVQLHNNGRQVPACAECRQTHSGEWRYPK